MNTVLLIDKNAATRARDSSSWRKHDMDALRVNSMMEAINLLTFGEDFHFIVINEDTIPGFILKLRKLRSVTNSPIFVITSSYTAEKEIQASNCGADAYNHSEAYAKNNTVGALSRIFMPISPDISLQ